MLGGVPGTALVDWPITYDELEPYYTKAEWELGVSGEPGPFDPPRSRPYPMPPLPVKSSGVLLERGARALGLHPQPSPMAINSQPYNGRPACQHCGFCLFFMCEFRAKSTSMATMLPLAEATGRCEIRPDSYVARVETGPDGRATGVSYFDAQKQLQLQRARAVVLCANGGETPRLLLNSESSRFPNGLANSSGVVGKHLMFNTYFGVERAVRASAERVQERPEHAHRARLLRDGSEARILRRRRHRRAVREVSDHLRARRAAAGIADVGRGFRPRPRRAVHANDVLRHATARRCRVEANSVTIDPALKDAWGLPCMRVTYKDHPDDLKNAEFLSSQALRIAQAAGALKTWPRAGSAADPVRPPARHVPDGQRSAHLGDRQVPPHARREESVHLRRQQHGDLVARTADRDDLGARVQGRRAHRGVRQARRDLTIRSTSTDIPPGDRRCRARRPPRRG